MFSKLVAFVVASVMGAALSAPTQRDVYDGSYFIAPGLSLGSKELAVFGTVSSNDATPVQGVALASNPFLGQVCS